MQNNKPFQPSLINKKFIIIILIILFAALSYVFYNDQKVANPLPIGERDSDEVEDIVKNNSGAIEEAQKSVSSIVTSVNNDDHFLGDITAPVEVIYYADASAPFVSQILTVINQLAENYPEEVKVAYRHFVTGDNLLGVLSANALECAGEEDKFWGMLEQLFTLNQENNIVESEIVAKAGELGLDSTDFANCLAGSAYQEKILTQSSDGEKYGVSGVPTIFVNKIILPGAYPFEDFTDSAGIEREGLKTIIDKELKIQ